MKKQNVNAVSSLIPSLLTSLVTVVCGAFLTAYLVNSHWNKSFEQFKNKISFEKEAAMKGFSLSESLFLDAASLYQNISHYRGADLLPSTFSQKDKELIEALRQQSDSVIRITDKLIAEQLNSFQIKLIAAKPFIPNALFEQLGIFSQKSTTVIFGMNKKQASYDQYQELADHLDKSIQMFRRSYNLDQLEASVLLLKREPDSLSSSLENKE